MPSFLEYFKVFFGLFSSSLFASWSTEKSFFKEGIYIKNYY